MLKFAKLQTRNERDFFALVQDASKDFVRLTQIPSRAKRRDDRSGVYSFERGEDPVLEPEQEKRFRANKAAWEFFQSQAPSYRRTAIHLVTSAKRPDTRVKRLNQLIEDSAAGRRIKELSR